MKTSAGRRRLRPNLPRRIPAAPQPLQHPLVAQRVHALPKALVTVRGELTLPGEPFERVELEAALIPIDVAEDFRLEHEESSVDPAFADLRLLGGLPNKIND